jgi:membrane protein involved in colicin uptake
MLAALQLQPLLLLLLHLQQPASLQLQPRAQMHPTAAMGNPAAAAAVEGPQAPRQQYSQQAQQKQQAGQALQQQQQQEMEQDQLKDYNQHQQGRMHRHRLPLSLV